MSVDPQLQPFLDLLASSGSPAITDLQPDAARALMANLRGGARAVEVHAVHDRTVPGPAGAVPVRVYCPPGDGPFPALVWFHGGGWVLGSIDESDPVARGLSVAADCVVISVGYRLAPEHPFPAGLDDCVAALRWCADHAGELGIDGDRLAVGGDSAGGNLAAAAAMVARDTGGPPLRLQVLVYPVTDFDVTTPSMVDNAEGYLLTRDAMQWFYDHYTDPSQRDDPRAAPLRATELAGLPPALVLTAEFDPLRDEGEAYARRLVDAGVDATVSRYDGMIHGFLGMTALCDRAVEAEAEVGAALRVAFGTERPGRWPRARLTRRGSRSARPPATGGR